MKGRGDEAKGKFAQRIYLLDAVLNSTLALLTGRGNGIDAREEHEGNEHHEAEQHLGHRRLTNRGGVDCVPHSTRAARTDTVKSLKCGLASNGRRLVK